jgi:hypothetical protein
MDSNAFLLSEQSDAVEQIGFLFSSNEGDEGTLVQVESPRVSSIAFRDMIAASKPFLLLGPSLVLPCFGARPVFSRLLMAESKSFCFCGVNVGVEGTECFSVEFSLISSAELRDLIAANKPFLLLGPSAG